MRVARIRRVDESEVDFIVWLFHFFLFIVTLNAIAF